MSNNLNHSAAKNNVWIIGAGNMALAYFDVLTSLNKDLVVIGRGEASAIQFEHKTGHKVIQGGLDNYLEQNPQLPDACIVCTGVDLLSSTTLNLLKYGVKNILLEKPGALFKADLLEIATLASAKGAEIAIAYNRRFYSSVEKAREIIEEDGGVDSFFFEVTEWAHVIEKLDKSQLIKERWFLGNTSHVADLAFHLGGIPEQISCHVAGNLAWHPAASSFAGSGKTVNGKCFAYHGNWSAPGRWSLELLTKYNRLILRPMEKLHIQKIGKIEVSEYEIDDELDIRFKPGLVKQTEAFFSGDKTRICLLSEHIELFDVYEKMAGYMRN